MIWYNVDRVRGVGIMDNLSYFKGLIMCTKCGKKFNKKLNGFICSGFKNYGKDFCNSKFIPLNMLLRWKNGQVTFISENELKF